MRATLALIGMAAVGAGLVLAVAAAPQPPAPAQTKADASAPTKAEVPNTAPVDAPLPAGVAPDDKALGESLAAFVKAYNAQDAPALTALYTDDAAVIDSDGAATRGRQDIAVMYAGGFADAPGLKLEANLEAVRKITPDVVEVEGQARLSGGTGSATQVSRYSALLVKRDGKWLFAELRDSPAPEADITSYDRLRELQWMIGDWVDESETSRVTASVRWADKQSYLVRTYTVELQGEKSMSGTMFIGWDPQTSQIKSWVFDSEGGHGEGLWTRVSDEQWIVKAHGVLRDGRPTSATQIHTVLNKDSVKTASVDRIIGGEIAPDVPEIVMVRKPPGPGNTAPPTEAKPAAPGAAK